MTGPSAGRTGERALRARTFLAPSIPERFFAGVTEHLQRALGRRIDLDCESRSSGPMHGDFDPFAAGEADIGFVCSPSYLYLRAQEQPSVELVPAAFVFNDPRHRGEPVYFADVVVRAGHSARRFEDLAGTVWGFNDECSLSGYFSALQKLQSLGCNGTFFRTRVRTGSHGASIAATLAGEIDAAAIDSTVLALRRREQPSLASELRVIDSWGPFPIQPIVVRRALGTALRDRIARALLALGEDAPGYATLAAFGLRGCVPIDDAAYAEERRALRELGELDELPSEG